MTSLVAASVVFVLIHFLVSGTRLRDALTGAIGEGPYMGLFSLASIAAIVWMSMAYGQANGGPDNVVLWAATPQLRWAQLGLTLLAFLFAVPGLATPNPTSLRQERAVFKPARGMLRITRHPFLWGAAIWAAGHVLTNGDAASVIFFGAFLVLATFGPASIDAKRRRKLGERRWAPFARQTSNVPFAAILAGRQSLSLREIGWWRIGLAVLIWSAVLGGHRHVFGVSPLP